MPRLSHLLALGAFSLSLLGQGAPGFDPTNLDQKAKSCDDFEKAAARNRSVLKQILEETPVGRGEKVRPSIW